MSGLGALRHVSPRKMVFEGVVGDTLGYLQVSLEVIIDECMFQGVF